MLDLHVSLLGSSPTSGRRSLPVNLLGGPRSRLSAANWALAHLHINRKQRQQWQTKRSTMWFAL